MEEGTPFTSGNDKKTGCICIHVQTFNILHSNILIGLKPSNLSDAKNKSKISIRFTKESLNDEGGVIAGHTMALNGVHESSSRGALHMHLMIWAAIALRLKILADFRRNSGGTLN